MITFNIYHNNKLEKTFENQKDDLNAFKWMLNHQGQSIDHAIKYEGWKVEVIDEDTGAKTYWG